MSGRSVHSLEFPVRLAEEGPSSQTVLTACEASSCTCAGNSKHAPQCR